MKIDFKEIVKLYTTNTKNPDDPIGQRDYFLKIIEAMPNNVYWLNKDCVTMGCNRNVLDLVGLDKLDDFVGITYEEMGRLANWTEGQAMSFKKDDMEVIATGMPKLNVLEPPLYDKDHNPIYYMSSRVPLFDDKHEVIGVLGISVDITERVKAEEREKEALEEVANAEARAQEQEKFTKTANQVAHDIRSPLASLLMIIKSCHDIPETERIALREAAISIGDIANNLLSKYREKELDAPEHEDERQPLLLSVALLQMLTEKKFQYDELPVRFDYNFSQEAHFAYIQMELSPFKRMISNLINNAVDALEDSEGSVTIQLDVTIDRVYVTIADNGKGMSPALVKKILEKIAVTEGKRDGHGIGLSQVRETLERNEGVLSIKSLPGKGTQMILEFPRIKAPDWIAEEINLNWQDIVVILDDDSSIHMAWDARFEPIIEKASELVVYHFENCQEAIQFINGLSETDRDRVYLLTDFELLKQELNGLHVVEKTAVRRSILVTSHYVNAIIHERAIKMGTKILPKQLASEISISIEKRSVDEKQTEKNEDVLKIVDLVFVDDNQSFSQTVIDFIFDENIVDYYSDPRKFLANLGKYPKDTRIYLDNNYTMVDTLGIEIAKDLHELGFTRLYLLSGDVFKPGDVPNYVKAILKTDIDKIKDW